MTLYKWSQTAAANATADSLINWAEGQSPSSVNDSARAMMAVMARYRDDTGGQIGGGGTSSAFTVTTNQGFDSLAHLDSQSVSFVAPSTNAAGATLNVDSLGPKPICVDASGTPIPAGVLVAGTVYQLTYYNSVGQFRLWNLYANPFNIPLAGGMDYWGPSAPNSNFAFPAGQAISRSTYATLFAITGATYGGGDGSTTFNLPDLRGRVVAGKDDMGGSAASRITIGNSGFAGTSLGAAGGNEVTTLTAGQIPSGVPVSVSGNISVTSTVGNILASNGPADNFSSIGGATTFDSQFKTAITSTGANSMTGTTNGSGNPHLNVQPTIICNYIVRII